MISSSVTKHLSLPFIVLKIVIYISFESFEKKKKRLPIIHFLRNLYIYIYILSTKLARSVDH